MKFKWMMSLAIGLAVAAGSHAANFRSNNLPAGSNWYLHVNIDLMRSSNLGQSIMEETIGEAFADIEEEFGVQFTQDIDAITVFGGELPPERGAVVIHGLFDEALRDELLVAVERKGANVITHDFAGMTYFEAGGFSNERDRHRRAGSDGQDQEASGDHRSDSIYFAFGETQSMFTQSIESIEKFLEAGGQLGDLKAVGPDAMVVLQADRALLQGGLNAAGNHINSHWDSSILSNVDSIAVVLADENGAASLHAEVQAKSPEIAESVRNIIEGLVALKALDVADEPALGELLRATRISTDGVLIRFDLFMDEALIEGLKEL